MLAPHTWIIDLLRDLGSEPFKVRMAFYTGITAAAAATVAALWTLVLRVIYRIAENRSKNVKRRWTEILLEALDGDDPATPVLRRRDRRTVIGRFNYLFETLTGEAHEHLRSLAYSSGIDGAVLTMVDDRNAAESLTGIVAAGHLRLNAAREQILRSLHDPRTAHALAAAHALVRIDAENFLTPVVEEFGRRPDWHVTRVAEVLAGTGGRMGDRLALLLESSVDAPDMIRIIEAVEALADPIGTNAVRGLLHETAGTQRANRHVIAVAIRALSRQQDPRDAELLARFCEHPDSAVRRETAIALGRVGDIEQEPALLGLVADVNPWVRYEAARAFLDLPGMDDARIAAALDATTDPVAAAVLNRAIAERVVHA